MANNQILASDNFASGSLAAGWSALPTASVCQVVAGSPNVTEGNTVGTEAAQIWTGLAWPNNQSSEITIKALSSSSIAVLRVRVQAGTTNSYQLNIVGNGASSSAALYILNSGQTLLKSATGLTVAAGDVWVLQAAGSALSVYQNGQRIIFFYDATWSSGTPGFGIDATSALTNAKISSWTGYSAVQQDGIWSKQGIVIPAIAADYAGTTAGTGIQSWSVFQDTNAQILSGTVYKTWLVSDWSNDTTSAMYYAESTDGVNWTRGATAVLSGYTNGFVVKNGSTYYMYCQASGSSGSGTMQVFTSSNGITWNLQSPSQTLSPGGSGAWDHSSFYNLISVTIVGGTWYGFYNGANGGAFSTGLATSTDGINWVKYASNPVISNFLPSNALIQVGSLYYMWCTGHQTGQGTGSTVLDPFEIVRFSSPNLITWTLSSHSVHKGQMFEALNATTGGLTPVSILNIGGNAYIYTNSSQSDSAAPAIGQIGLAIAPTSISGVVGFSELATSQTASDGFAEGTGNLPATWTTPTGLTKLTIASGNLCEASTTSTLCGMAYTGASFGNDQYSEITIGTLGTGQFFQPTVRMATGSQTYYTFGVTGTANASAQFSAVVSGTTTTFAPIFTPTTISGDVIRLTVTTVNGLPLLSAYQNGFLIAQYLDQANLISSGGSPGIVVYTTTLAQATASLWAGGNASVIPYPSGGGIGTTLTSGAATPATVTNTNGVAQLITTPTVTSKLGQPTAIVFCDPNGNEYAITGSTAGAELEGPTPVVLCTTQGKAIAPTYTLTSNGNSIVVTATLTGTKRGQPVPVCISDPNGFAYTTTGFASVVNYVANPTPICLTDQNGNVLTLTIGN